MKIKSRIQSLLWAVLFVVAMSFSAYAADGQIKIGQTPLTTFPIVIDQPGSYVLTSNLVISTANVCGLVITTDDVTLDLNGHAIIGPGMDTGGVAIGINGKERKNVSILNGTVRDFSGDGINLHGASWGHIPANGSNNLLKNLKTYSNGMSGIAVSNAVVTNSSANSNGWIGIASESSIITNNTTNDNGITGIHAIMSTATNCIASFNGTYGIRAVNSTISNCTTNSNGGDGIRAFMQEFDTSSSLIINCTANSNDRYGITASYNCRIEGNNLRDNGAYGLYLGASQNYAIKNSASNNANGNFWCAADNYMPTSLTEPDAANANIGW